MMSGTSIKRKCQPLKPFGYQFVLLEVAVLTVTKARVLVAPNAGKSIVSHDWLVALRYRISQPIERGESEKLIQNASKR